MAKALFAGFCLLAIAIAPASAYDTLAEDYEACIQNPGPNQETVSACTRLIDNAAQEGPLLSYFYAMRATFNSDAQSNCRDARRALELADDPRIVDAVNQLIDINC